jgi:hypothetical protein
MAADLEMDADDQDMAEIFDEENITTDGVDIATSDMQRDVYDVTTAEDDSDDDEFGDGNDDDFDPDQADDAELDEMLEADDGVDSPGPLTRDDADLVTATEESPADYQGDSDEGDQDQPHAAPSSPPTQHEQRELDHGLEETFPASDPVSITPGAD